MAFVRLKCLKYILVVILAINLFVVIFIILSKANTRDDSIVKKLLSSRLKTVEKAQSSTKSLDFIKLNEIRKLPIIFIGGYGRSGTTLMRAILDVHPAISCGPETKVLPTFLSYLNKFIANRGVQRDLFEAGVETHTIGEAASSFIYYVLKYRKANNVSSSGLHDKLKPQERLCCKDPDILHYVKYLHEIFPNAKFVRMIRDGRAAAYSFMLRVKERITFRKFLNFYDSWNSYNRQIDMDCDRLGPAYCITVRYEDLIANTKTVLQRVVAFLNETWTDELLRHEKHFGDQIKVSNLEWSTLQIKNKIYNDSLAPIWLDHIPDYNPAMINTQVLKRYGYNLTLGVNTRNSTIIAPKFTLSRLDHLNQLDRFDRLNRMNNF
jgi:protein-tyrosine sulfotransferase